MMRRSSALSALSILVSTLLLGSFLQAQSSVGVVRVGTIDSALGGVTAAVGDINGDGCADLLTAGVETNDSAGRVLLLSGLDGSVIHSLDGTMPGQLFGSAMAGLDDLDQDGVPDFAIAASDGIYLFSGVDAAQLLLIPTFARQLLGLDDVNGDGVPDLAISSPLPSSHIEIYSGLDGLPLATSFGSSPGGTFSMTSIDDRDGDGLGDIAANSFNGAAIDIISSQDGSTIQVISTQTNAFAAGQSVIDGRGDFDGDGHSDLATRTDLQTLTIFSGADGSTLTTLTILQPIQFDAPLTFIGDWNADGTDDLAAIEYDTYIGRRKVTIFSGGTGSRLERFDTRLSGFSPLNRLNAIGDANGDGSDDLIVHNPYSFGRLPDGSVGAGLTQIAYGAGPVLRRVHPLGFTAAMDLSWFPTNGDVHDITGNLECTGASPGASGVIFGSLDDREVVQLGYLPQFINFDPYYQVYEGYFGFDATGSLLVPGLTRQIPSAAGFEVHVQVFEYAPFLESSNSLVFEILP